MELKAYLKELPVKPGIYMFIDKTGDILYIGRATFLRKRVANYFRKDIDRRIQEMVSQAVKIRHHETDSVLEAIILEANLIKQHQPKYNIKDKDQRSFIYIVIPKKVDFPRPIIVRERELKRYPQDSAHVFGPYQSYYVIRQLLKAVRKIFPFSTCTPNSGKPCFNYQIGECPGICIGAVSKKEYQDNIKNMILLLSGEKRRLITKLKKTNPDLIWALNHVHDVALLSRDDLSASYDAHRIEGYDISHLTGQETVGAMVVFTGGEADKNEYRLFNIKSVGNNDLHALAEMLTRRFNHPEWARPDLILIDGGRPQIDYVIKALRELNIEIPIVGLSKFAGDMLVFPAGTKKELRELAEGLKRTLQQVRDEAHRFGRLASRRQRSKRVPSNITATKTRRLFSRPTRLR